MDGSKESNLWAGLQQLCTSGGACKACIAPPPPPPPPPRSPCIGGPQLSLSHGCAKTMGTFVNCSQGSAHIPDPSKHQDKPLTWPFVTSIFDRIQRNTFGHSNFGQGNNFRSSAPSRDPYIIHLNIATCTWWFPFLLVLKKPHVSNGCKNGDLLRRPAEF